MLLFYSSDYKSVTEKKAAAYGQLIIYLAQRHRGRGWLAYDRLFRQQIASVSSLAGNKFAPSLMASTVLYSGYLRTTCQLCNGADHTTFGYALFHSSSTKKSSSSSNLDLQSKKMKIAEPCKRFNRGVCNQNPNSCKYLHVCSECGATSHPSVNCHSKGDLIDTIASKAAATQ